MSVIRGRGYGDTHDWERPEDLQFRISCPTWDGEKWDFTKCEMGYPIGRPTTYRCTRCGARFDHHYHDVPDIFEAMKQANVPAECPVKALAFPGVG